MAEEIKKPAAQVPAARSPLDSWSLMRSDMDRFFDSMFGGRGFPNVFGVSGGAVGGMIAPSIDVHENEKELVIAAELPGMEEKDVQLSFRDGVLTIKGKKKSERDETKDDVHISERSYGSFQRSFRVPDTVEVDKATADFEKGVLKVTLPKVAEAVSREKKIPIGKG
ncbi:MAG: Hsp20/alpha crystallin family protein [Hyphomicrobiaceae bacterium]|nr:Hsp20/alpha crystallin family protein [Hyphomicrobiaceae bacterium]MCC0008704.1 Hsp20/alpha crystallin family protein [Hyphomicrobiaceae bacterium]